MIKEQGNSMPIEEQGIITQPDEAAYNNVCSRFWQNIDKAANSLCKYEIPYVQDVLNCIVRPQLVTVMSWKAGMLNDFNIDVGESGKRLYNWLSEDEWESFLLTYCGGIAGEIWQSIFVMCDMFDETAAEVGFKLGFKYNIDEAAAAISSIQRLRNNLCEGQS